MHRNATAIPYQWLFVPRISPPKKVVVGYLLFMKATTIALYVSNCTLARTVTVASDVHQYKSVKKRRLGQLFDTNRVFCDESKAGCTYGRGGEEINDNTRHDYVSLELNTLRVRGKNGNRGQLYTSIRRCPPPFCPLYLLLLLTRPSLSLSSQRSIYCAVVRE